MVSAAVIDCGMGNLSSVAKGLGKAGFTPFLTSQPEEVLSARAIVLPGVGSFGAAVSNLQQAGLFSCLRQAAASGQPILGICLGFQLMFASSEEAPGAKGLELLPGEVKRFGPGVKVPHIGWNNLNLARQHPLWNGIGGEDSYFYFVHSYYVAPCTREIVLARSDYGISFCAAAGRDNLLGVQFHPEKSSDLGLKVLGNFYDFVVNCR